LSFHQISDIALISNKKHIKFMTGAAILSTVLLVFSSCSSTKPYTLGPVKTFDPDTSRIPMPDEAESYQYWDRVESTIFHQIEKPLDLNRVFRAAGNGLGLNASKQADNINVLDEVPESSWYTYRHFYIPMSTEELAKGPNTVKPDTSGYWNIFSAKLSGANPGFFIQDANGERFLIKFDGPKYPELTTSAEVIGTKIFYAAGYFVPESTIINFNPDKVRINDGVMVEENGQERQMTMEDYRQIITVAANNDDGTRRALASKFVDGIPLGPWDFKGTRKDDPNDRVKHEHRRELRGMRVISSWLNDTDRRDANTMSVYTDGGYIRHLVQDFGNTLGANGTGIHQPIYGQAYLIDPRYMALSAVTLGLYIKPWEEVDPQEFIPYPSVGYFRTETLRPGRWVSAHPIPAFENMTLRDAYWGAKQVMSFRDDDIRAIVETGELSNRDAEEYLIQILIERRDIIGRYWFSKINPLDKFEASKGNGDITLHFSDLGVDYDLFSASETEYRYSVSEEGDAKAGSKTINEPRISVSSSDIKSNVLEFNIVTIRKDINAAEKNIRVYVVNDSRGVRVAGIQRAE